MFWFINRVRHDFGGWDRLTRISVILALVLILGAVVIFFVGPSEIRTQAAISVGGLIVILQIAILWGNRGMVSTYSQAQRLYLRGDFEVARAVLEHARSQGRADARMLTLLGNTHRQLGDLETSALILSEAVDKAPNHHFPLYGFGRTLLSQGEYVQAAHYLRRALESGAPPTVLADMGEVYFRLNMRDDAKQTLTMALGSESKDAPHRALMVGYLLGLLDGSARLTPELIRDGLPYWRASAERYGKTPYGQALTEDVRAIEKINEEH